MSLVIKRAPAVNSNERAWAQVYDDINDIIKAVNRKSTDESRTKGSDGEDGNIRLFKDNVKSKYFIEGKFKDGWAKRELLYSDADDATQDESINFSSTESYIKPDGSVPFTSTITGVAPSNALHLATKGYADTGRLTSVTKSGNNLVFGMTDTSSNITFSQFGSNAFNSTAIPTTFVASLTNADASGQTLIEASTGSLYRLGGGDNITITTDDPGGGQTWVQIDCDINTTNFLTTSVNMLAGVRSFSGDSIDWIQQAGAGGYITFDDEGSNVTFSNVTVDSDNKPAVRITAPTTTNTNTTYSVSIPSATTKLRLTAGGSGSGTDDIEFVGGGATSVTRTNADKFTISSNNNFITGASCNSNGLLTLTGTGSAGATVDLGEHLLTGITSSMVTTALGFTPYNNTNPSGYMTASSTNTLTNKSGSNSQWTNDENYISGNQTITLSGDASGSGTTSISVTVADDSHNHTIANVDNLQTSLDAKAALAGATFTGGVACNGNTTNNPHLVVGGTGNMVNSSAVMQCKGFIRVGQHLLIHEASSGVNVANAVGLTYANDNLSVYASSGLVAENDGQANFHVPGDVIAYYSSDPRLKTNKKPLESSLHKLSNIKGYTFNWLPEAKKYNSYNEGSDIGVMADEIEAMYPDLVETRDNGYKAVKYEKLTAVLIAAVNELTNKLIQRGVLDEEL